MAGGDEDSPSRVVHLGEIHYPFGQEVLPQGIEADDGEPVTYLCQGQMTVIEYSTQFTELTRYPLMVVMDEEKRARKFEGRQRLNIRFRVVPL